MIEIHRHERPSTAQIPSRPAVTLLLGLGIAFVGYQIAPRVDTHVPDASL